VEAAMSSTTNIIRPIYLDKIKGYIDKPDVKIITGLRRSGKTEILKMVRDEIKSRVDHDQIIYINFEELDYAHLLDAKELNKYFLSAIKDDRRYYVFLDEIQDVKGWERTVNGLRLKNTDIYITGSNSKIMSDELETHLGGRTISFRANTLSFAEFINFRKINTLSTDSIMDELNAYIDIGGFPILSVVKYNDAQKREVVKEICDTALFRDVVKRRGIRHPQLLDKIVAFLFDNVGSLVSIRAILNYLKSSGRGADHETVANYIKHLEDAFIIKSAPIFDIKGKRLLEVNDKFYLGDHALQYAVRQKRMDKVQGILENIVFNDIIRRGYKVSVGKFDNKEVDFVAEEVWGSRKIYVQVCYEFTTIDTYNREFAPLMSIKDSYPKYVVTMDKNWQADENGVMGIHLKDFLLKDSL